MASIFSLAVPLPPEIIAPACPMRFPGGAVSRLDSPLIFGLLERTDATALVADKYRKYTFFRLLVEAVGGIWINREQADFHAMREAVDHLHQGGLLGVAPEGTRSRTGALTSAKTGAAYLVDRAGAPVIPVSIWGTETAVRQLLHLRRPPLHIRFGRPFCLPPLPRHARAGGLQRNTDEIMCRLAAQLPERYRGAYAGHPRLQELLAGQGEKPA